MRAKKQYTPSEALEVLANGLYEIRIISKVSSPKSMYTADLSTLDAKLKKVADNNSNIYFTLGELNPALYSRSQREKILSGNKLSTTSDGDILSYRWILIDLDPKRISDVASSDAEKKKAHTMAGEIYKSLIERGFSENGIVVADSGNGYHLLVRVNLPNNPENVELVKNFLKALDFNFSDESTEVDIKNFNPSRITKCYGTVAHKGMDTAERPHRRSNLLAVPDEIEVCDKSLIESIAASMPKREATSYSRSNYSTGSQSEKIDFLKNFIAKYNIRGESKSKGDAYFKYILEEDPFNSNHKNAMIGVSEDGILYFHCFHNSCSQYTWRDFRRIYEPNFEREQEERRQAYEESQRRKKSSYSSNKPAAVNVNDMVDEISAKSDIVKEEEKKEEVIDESKDWFTLEDGWALLNCEEEEEQGFPTGFSQLDNQLEGGILAKGTFSIISGDNSAGKSTFVNQLALNVASEGHVVAVYSGELLIKRFTKWILRQACGTQNMSESRSGNPYVPESVAKKIISWSKDKIYLYNNKKGQKVTNIIKQIIDCIEKRHAELIVIDNLMSMETDELGKDYGVDKQIIQASIKIAQNYNVHIILIAHPRKASGYLRKDDICGEKSIANLADNIFIMHRNNDDFIREYYLFKTGKKWFEGCKTGFEGYGNILEICKNRDNGKAVDKKIPFYFDTVCNRFLEERDEDIRFGWQEGYENPENHKSEKLPDIFDVIAQQYDA